MMKEGVGYSLKMSTKVEASQPAHGDCRDL